jgi:hypothetical protein
MLRGVASCCLSKPAGNFGNQYLQAIPSSQTSSHTLKRSRQAISASALCKFTLALTSFPEEFVKNAIYPHEFLVQS